MPVLHPKYGSVEINVWMPLHIPEAQNHFGNGFVDGLERSTIGIKNYRGMLTGKKHDPLVIQSTVDGGITWQEKKSVGGLYQLEGRRVKTTHVMLATAFPSIKALATVDHLNNDWHDDRIDNLAWDTRQHNAAKGAEVVRRERTGKPVAAISKDGTRCEYISICSAARHVVSMPGVSTEDATTVEAKITRSVGNNSTAYGSRWEYIQFSSIESEEWETVDMSINNDRFASITVSNKGRVIDSNGIISCGHLIRDKVYRSFGTYAVAQDGTKTKCTIYVHRAVYTAFVGPIPPGKKVFSGKAADKSQRNWVEDLCIGDGDERDIIEEPIPPSSSSVSQVDTSIGRDYIKFASRVYNKKGDFGEVLKVDNHRAFFLKKECENVLTCILFDASAKEHLLGATAPCMANKYFTVGRDKVPQAKYVWVNINGNVLPEGHFVGNLNGIKGDVRLCNLVVVPGNGKEQKSPKYVRLPDDVAALLDVEFLPRNITLYDDTRDGRKLSLLLGGEKTNGKLSRCILEDMKHRLSEWYKENEPNCDYHKKHNQYIERLKEYYAFCASGAVTPP
jgi:hypothetical protein